MFYNKLQILPLINIAYNQDIFFVLILLSFLLVSLIKGFYWKHSKLFFMSIFAQRYSNQYLREDNAFTERVNLLTFLLMVVNFTLIIAKFKMVINLLGVAYVASLVSLFFLVKFLCIKILGALFKLKDIARLAVFFTFLFDKTLGFLIFPLVVCIYFFSFDISTVILLASFILFVILLIMKLFWMLKIGTKLFGLTKGYIFLYLCILEVFPILLLAKGVF